MSALDEGFESRPIVLADAARRRELVANVAGLRSVGGIEWWCTWAACVARGAIT